MGNIVSPSLDFLKTWQGIVEMILRVTCIVSEIIYGVAKQSVLLNFARGVGEPIAQFYHHTVTRYFRLHLNMYSEAHHHFMCCKDFLSVSFINRLVIIIQVIASSITNDSPGLTGARECH